MKLQKAKIIQPGKSNVSDKVFGGETPDHVNEGQAEQIREKEDEKIVKYLTETDAYRIILAIDGEMLDSVALSEKIEKLATLLQRSMSLPTILFLCV